MTLGLPTSQVLLMVTLGKWGTLDYGSAFIAGAFNYREVGLGDKLFPNSGILARSLLNAVEIDTSAPCTLSFEYKNTRILRAT